MPHPYRSCSRQLHHSEAHGPQPDPKSSRQRLRPPEAQSRRMGRRLPRKPHRRMRHSPDSPGPAMNVIVFASRKGGTGKSTLVAHLASHCYKAARSCLLIDCDPQGSLTLWHRLRNTGETALKNGLRDFNETIESAQREGVEWVFVDTPPLISEQVSEAVSAATLIVIPTRPCLLYTSPSPR